jgi:hypothetical protein
MTTREARTTAPEIPTADAHGWRIKPGLLSLIVLRPEGEDLLKGERRQHQIETRDAKGRDRHYQSKNRPHHHAQDDRNGEIVQRSVARKGRGVRAHA